jgi:DNA (cytosine-5)-methyltransferase 1
MSDILDQLLSLCGQVGVPLRVQPPVAVVPLVASTGNGTAPIALSFCSGVGGLDLGLERAGFKVILASETDPDARATVAANRPGLPVLGDLRDCTPADIRAAADIGNLDIDLVAAGPPCQTFSTAGKHRGTADERGEVLPKFVALALALAPRYIVVENVRGLMLDAAFDQVLKTFQDGGYAVSWNLYDSAYFGAPQRRERVIIIGSKNGRVPHLTPTHSDRPEDGLPPWRTLRDAIGDMGGIEHHGARYSPKRLECWQALRAGARPGSRPDYYRRLTWNEPAMTLLTNPSNFLSGCCHPEHDRPLSVEEYKRVQGFPDHWKVCGNLRSRYRQLGNAVPVPLGQAVGRTIIEHMRTRRSEDPVPGFRYSRHHHSSDRKWNKVEPKGRTSIMDNNLGTLDQLHALCGLLNVPLPPPPLPELPAPSPVEGPAPEPEVYQPTPDIACYCPCDFRQLPVEPRSVKLIATDIPYDDKWLSEVPDFAAWCADKLTDDGVLVTFYGHSHLDECLHLLSKHLVYQWQLISPIYGVARSYGRFVARYQFAVVFSKSKEWHPRQAVADIMPAGERVPGKHPHRKTVHQMQFIIEAFSNENDRVADPCAGSWTTAIAAYKTCRRFVGGEQDAQWMAEAMEKFGRLLKE